MIVNLIRDKQFIGNFEGDEETCDEYIKASKKEFGMFDI